MSAKAQSVVSKKKGTPIPDKNAMTRVCIDDFTFKKRHTYGTVMVEIDTHRIIDLIDSREIAEVTEWLKTYPNLEIVSRDGSISYKSAIKRAGEDIIQISYRFHLLLPYRFCKKTHNRYGNSKFWDSFCPITL